MSLGVSIEARAGISKAAMHYFLCNIVSLLVSPPMRHGLSAQAWPVWSIYNAHR